MEKISLWKQLWIDVWKCGLSNMKTSNCSLQPGNYIKLFVLIFLPIVLLFRNWIIVGFFLILIAQILMLANFIPLHFWLIVNRDFKLKWVVKYRSSTMECEHFLYTIILGYFGLLSDNYVNFWSFYIPQKIKK